MDHQLTLYIKKTKKHLYVFLLQNGMQVMSISTDSKLIKKNLNLYKEKQLSGLLAHIFASKLQASGISVVSLAQTNVFHGKIATIVQILREYGILVK
jgi:ribosomal protein L18